MISQSNHDPLPDTGDVGPDTAPGEDRRTGEDRRAERRVPAHEIPHITARLSGPGDARLVDLSPTGARFQSERRFLPNAAVSLRLVTPDSTLVVSGRVARSRIVRLESGGLGYDVAISFSPSASGLLGGAAEPVAAAADGPAPVADAGEDGQAIAASDAIEATIVTAAVSQSSEELRELFNGNHW